MHRRLSHRPKTSSGTDDSYDASNPPFHHAMKRTASQTFAMTDVRDVPMLDAVNESTMGLDENESYHSHTNSSLSRAFSTVAGPFSRRRRLSSFSSATTAPRRRGSIQSFIDSWPSKSSVEQPRLPLQHHDSGMTSTTPTTQPQGLSSSSRSFSFKRLGSLRRRPAPGAFPSEGFKTLTPPSSSTSLCPPLPGTAARQAAAAANQDRQNQLRREQEQEHTHRFLQGLLPASMRDDEMKDNESGVDMTCASPIISTDCAPEKKMIDPFRSLPAELATAVLSNLDAKSLARAEQVSRSWRIHASSIHVWRHVFLRKYEQEVHVSPTPIQMGGEGIGKMIKNQPAPAQNFKKMYEARTEIEKRWKSGKPAAIYLNGHTDSVYCCQFDENKAITGSRDRTVRVWDLKTYKCVKVYGGPNHRPTPNTPPPMDERPECVTSNPSLNGSTTGNSIYHVPSDYHDASILCLQYDDEIMVTGSSDFTCIVWDITGDEFVPLYRLRGHEAGVLDVCLDNKYIISCSKDAMIKVWDRKTGLCIRTLKGHRGPVNAVQLRGNFLVSASGDGVAKLWNLETGQAVKDFPSEDRGLAAVEFSDDAKYVLAGGNDHVVYKFDASTGELVHSRVKHEGLVRSLFLDAFNGRIVSGSYDQSIQVSDYETGAMYATYKNWTTSWILSAKSDYRRVVATSQDGRTLILDFGHKVDGAELLVGSS